MYRRAVLVARRGVTWAIAWAMWTLRAIGGSRLDTKIMLSPSLLATFGLSAFGRFCSLFGTARFLGWVGEMGCLTPLGKRPAPHRRGPSDSQSDIWTYGLRGGRWLPLLHADQLGLSASVGSGGSLVGSAPPLSSERIAAPVRRFRIATAPIAGGAAMMPCSSIK